MAKIGAYLSVYEGDVSKYLDNPKFLETRLLASREANSYVRQMIDFIYTRFDDKSLVMNNTAGGTTSIAPGTDFRCDPGVGVDDAGIIVGDGNTAVAIGDYALAGSRIDHGTGAGQLEYGVSSVNTPQTVGSKRQFTCSRVFTNNSGASITSEEIVLYCARTAWSTMLMVERTVQQIVHTNGNSKTITYTLYVEV